MKIDLKQVHVLHSRKQASMGEHARIAFDQLMDRLPGNGPVIPPAVSGGLLGAGIGGTAALAGNSILKTLTNGMSSALGLPQTPEAVYNTLKFRSALGQGIASNISPAQTKVFRYLTALGRKPSSAALAIGIPAAILAFINNIRSRRQ